MKSDFPEIWFRGLDEKEKESFLATLKFSPVLKRFLEILDSLESEVERDESDYNNPSWAYRQADLNGSRRTIKKIKKLFQSTLTKGKE